MQSFTRFLSRDYSLFIQKAIILIFLKVLSSCSHIWRYQSIVSPPVLILFNMNTALCTKEFFFLLSWLSVGSAPSRGSGHNCVLLARSHTGPMDKQSFGPQVCTVRIFEVATSSPFVFLFTSCWYPDFSVTITRHNFSIYDTTRLDVGLTACATCTYFQ
jgi:hypothetical protein